MALVSNQTELQRALDQCDPLIETINGFTIESQIIITCPVTIQSQAATPIREPKRRTGYTGGLFSVATGGNLVMRNLILGGDKKNTLVTQPILNTVSALTKEPVTVQNNASTTDGGGIHGAGADSNASMINSLFRAATAAKTAAACSSRITAPRYRAAHLQGI